MAFLISFDIDGTMEFGDPPGGITVEMVLRAQELGFLIGSCSDRFPSAQRSLWETREVRVDFVAAKHMLPDIRDRFAADRYLHIGDRDIDKQLAEQAGFEFLWDHEGVHQPWLAWLSSHALD
ncbi:MAG: HAD family hydrolase [Dehalococcoidia bacterium]